MMDAETLVQILGQYELLLWLRGSRGWTQNADIMAAMDLDRDAVMQILHPLVAKGLVQTCVGACRLTDRGHTHAGELLADLLDPPFGEAPVI